MIRTQGDGAYEGSKLQNDELVNAEVWYKYEVEAG